MSAPSLVVSNNAERQTYELVFSSYDATIRPKTYPTDTVEVTIYLALKQVIGFVSPEPNNKNITVCALMAITIASPVGNGISNLC